MHFFNIVQGSHETQSYICSDIDSSYNNYTRKIIQHSSNLHHDPLSSSFNNKTWGEILCIFVKRVIFILTTLFIFTFEHTINFITHIIIVT